MDICQLYNRLVSKPPSGKSCIVDQRISEQGLKTSFKNCSIGVYPHAAFKDVPFHSHDFFELVYVHTGCCVNLVDDQEIPLKEGDICLLNTHAFHTLRCPNPDNTIIFNLLVSRDILHSSHFQLLSYNDLVANFFLNSLQRQRTEDNYIVFSKQSEEKKCNELCQQIITEYYENEGAIYQESKLIYLFDCLLIELIRNYQQQHNLSIGKKSTKYKISEVIEYMGEHCDSITLQSLADHFCYHPKHFSRILRETTGQNFSELLTELRMSRAKALLEDSQLSITKVMNQVGYHNYTWFGNQFQKQFGKAPSEYRINPKNHAVI